MKHLTHVVASALVAAALFVPASAWAAPPDGGPDVLWDRIGELEAAVARDQAAGRVDCQRNLLQSAVYRYQAALRSLVQEVGLLEELYASYEDTEEVEGQARVLVLLGHVRVRIDDIRDTIRFLETLTRRRR